MSANPRPRPCSAPGCGFDSPHAGGHGQPQLDPDAYCAPLRCYCGRCPPPAVPVLDPLPLAELRELARVEARRYRARVVERDRVRAVLAAVNYADDDVGRRAAAERRKRELARPGNRLMTAAAAVRAA